MWWIVTIENIPGLPSMCAAKSYDQELYLYWVFMIIVDAGERTMWSRYVIAVDVDLFIVSCILLLVQLVSACTFFRNLGYLYAVLTVLQTGQEVLPI